MAQSQHNLVVFVQVYGWYKQVGGNASTNRPLK
jgi:hypothetical protein